MAKKKKTSKISKKQTEQDSAYFLKLVMYLIIGSQWVRIESLPDWSIPIPAGLFIGLWFASKDHFKMDRKIEYALLLVAMFVSFWLPLGLIISL
ncbi:MAG: hypothetical protein Q7T41_00730 [Candidatus Saccharibacteria bacterium]|nr:hypothetical protein [Candidatus Saccharibacteria bacterium]